MKQSQKYPKQNNKIQIVKNKEIIIYQNGEEFKHFKQSETKELNENEMYILDFLINKYSLYEVPPRSSKLEENDFDFESTDEIFKKSSIKKNDASNTPYEEEGRKTEPQLKEFFKDVEEENGEEGNENMGKEKITQTKKLKTNIKTTEDVKVPIKRKNKNYHYEEQNFDIRYENEEDEDEEENEEEPPQYVIEAESYTSPTIRFIDERKAEHELLNGIKTSLMVKGEEKNGILFLGDNEEITFLCFEDQKETVISLNNLKRIYFNIRGSSNLINYKKKTNNERFIQFVELNNKKTDVKFSNDTELEYFVKGLIQTFKNKSTPLDKNLIYEKVKKFFTYSSNKKEVKNSINKNYSNNYSKSYSNSNNYNKTEQNPFQKKVTKTSYYHKRNEQKYDSQNNNNYDNNYYYNDNNEEKGINENYTEKENNHNYEENEGYENYDENNVENENEENYNENAENYIENENQNYENNEQNIQSYNNNFTNNKENNDDDNFITTTVTEVFKDGKLINEETKEEYQGVVTSLHSYSPDIGEYEEYLRKSTLRKRKASDDDINRSLDRVHETNKFKSGYESKKY